jgi:hypothetical protein
MILYSSQKVSNSAFQSKRSTTIKVDPLYQNSNKKSLYIQTKKIYAFFMACERKLHLGFMLQHTLTVEHICGYHPKGYRFYIVKIFLFPTLIARPLTHSKKSTDWIVFIGSIDRDAFYQPKPNSENKCVHLNIFWKIPLNFDAFRKLKNILKEFK